MTIRHVNANIAQSLVDTRGAEPAPSPGLRRAPATPSDAQLVALAQAGAHGVEARLYDRLAPIVNRVLWALLGPDAEHDDVVHEVFIKIFRNIAGLKKPESLEQWVARIAINTVRNELRARRLRRWVFWDAFDDPGPLVCSADEDGRELLGRVHRALAKLPPGERVVLSLRLFETDTLDDMAAMLACSRSTAKRRLRKARERFTRLAASDPLLRGWVEALNSPGLER